MGRVSVQHERFDAGAEIAALASRPDIGGIGCFIGQVRGGGGLRAMTLEHYPAMTEAALRDLVLQAEARWPLLGCTVIHRVGRLLVGEPIVLVVTASSHRQAALEATQFMIDWLKTDAPFWKCEEFENGARAWVEARSDDTAARNAWISAPASS